VPLGARRVGPGQRAYLVAEAGVNHGGSVSQALRLVDAAVAAGVDAVKFQVFHAAELVTAAAPAAAYQQVHGATDQRGMLTRLELTDADFAGIAAHCRAARVDFLATPFGPQDVIRLMALDVPALKLASTDLDNLPLVRCAADTGRPLLVSTGAATAEEIADAVARLRRLGVADRLVLLHCVSCYPTPLTAANLRAITRLAAEFHLPAGLSDHTTSTQTGGWAVAAGACVLEKHFTLDRAAPGPDHAMSLTPDELRAYVATVREAEAALGSGALGLSALERDVRRVARRSLVAARDLAAGAVLTPDDVCAKRPTGGIAPDQIDTVVGRRLRHAVAADTPLTWDLLA
jgi:N-acetylneuraminate synthase/N,N'-diacetyllegionaminate synthase